MKRYHKIQSVYKRDPDNNFKTFLIGEYSRPEFEYLKDTIWVFTEKVDGRNHRVYWNGKEVEHRGRNDNSQFSNEMMEAVEKMFTKDKFKIFDSENVTLFGELYGRKIQKGGGNYKSDGQDFVLFDVYIDGWWLKREDVEDIAKKLNINVIPIIGEGTLDEMVEMTKKGFNSQWGNFIAEGIVARPKVELRDRGAKRIITKVKHKDFK